MDPEAIKNTLKSMLEQVAEKARVDAQQGKSDISSIFEDEQERLPSIDIDKIEEAISNIDKATATKKGAVRLVNSIMVAARFVAQINFPT